MEWTDGTYRISTDKSLLSIDRICEFLAQSYWANQRTREKIELSIQNSICYGVYRDGQQIGFARAVTDLATFFWIGDVYIDEAFRGQGLGKKLIQCIVESAELQGLTGVLATNDAHGLYEQYGFVKDPVRYMRRQARPV
ncbi:putative GNAT family N-acyltransferase [Hydrogenispora ethanolica]|jgi:GNAT superfamily N-acetyltransferase|uniref:Putative GNAT family N-acyltransferase n=1 Tax=Hydrogenispora ethanolica TaxID=1082276 RepID=A0A4R1S662_HYDET|nr:GNAT family N-acetyltransferase [Hydrogenispora ethanolica]TCL74280.1 putative GNAT family N-acyltransferase [Hydrogenispora ethanolica]